MGLGIGARSMTMPQLSSWNELFRIEVILPKALLAFRPSRANRSILGSHRTTARALLCLLFLGAYAGTAEAASVPARTAFPVVGNVSFINDYGAPRAGGWHQGNDIMGRRHQPAIAFESGRVDKHVGSSIGTCMLYLRGRSGMTYVYIHLNNDLGPNNDNDGGCRNGVSWAPGLRDGDWVRRGELVGYVGDSGDANGIQPHLHFEIRKPGGSPINPYTHLKNSRHLLYPRAESNADVSLTFRKAKVIEVRDDAVKIRIRSNELEPHGWRYRYIRRLLLTVPNEAVVERRTRDGSTTASLGGSAEGEMARVWSVDFVPSWHTQRARPGTLRVERILIGGEG
jgi:hypothetical protein